MTTILPKEVIDSLNDPETVKVLTTTGENGVPHTVFKHTLLAMEDGNLGYVELIERSRTYKNMLRNHWAKKTVAVSIYNSKTGLAYQIKGMPYRYVVEGPIWSMFRDMVWSVMPDVEPAGVWLITPQEVLNEAYPVRYKEECERIKQFALWNSYPRKKVSSMSSK